MSELTSERYTVEKQKVRSAEIVVHGTVDKPYYEIEYQTTDGEWRIGYSSRKLEMVFDWLNECFEIVSYEQEIRDKAIDEFAEKMKEVSYQWFKHGAMAIRMIDEIAEQMKEVGE